MALLVNAGYAQNCYCLLHITLHWLLMMCLTLVKQARECHVCGERAGKHSYYGGQVNTLNP